MQIPESTVKNVQAIIDSQEGPITKWAKALDVLKAENLAYVVEAVPPTLFLVHPDNRSKLGVNPYNSHRTGAYIAKVGADLDLLKKATAFEMCPIDPVRSDQFAFNEQLVKQAGGMLAPITGKERYLSVGCGHTVQFCKAALASCKTPQSTLADKAGCLNAGQLSKDPAFATMLHTGWAWTIVSWRAEVAWPQLPDLAQRALNASNTVASQATELEVAACIAEFATMQLSVHGSIDWAKCGEAAAASMPPCSHYMATLVDFVRLYGGGEGAPNVKYLDEFAKTYGENLRLGEEFLKAVTEVQFGPSRKCPHVRTSLLAANFVSPKVVDGVAKLLVKSDVEKLKKFKGLDELENTLQTAWNIAEDLSIQKDIIGRMQTRCILWATGKQKQGFEKSDFKTLGEIRDKFVKEVSDIVHGGVNHEWFGGTTSQPKASAPSAPAASSNFADPSQADWLAKDAGFEIGRAYFEKAAGQSAGVYILKSISKDGCKLDEHSAVKPTILSVTVPFDKLLSAWAPYKGSLQAKLTVESKFTLPGSTHMELELIKGSIVNFLCTASNVDPQVDLAYFLFPSEVRTTTKIAKGQLALLPVTDFGHISSINRPGSVPITAGGRTMYLTEPAKPRTLDGFKADCVVVPFWWVTYTHNQNEVNMVPKEFKQKEHNLSITGLVNSRALQPHEALVAFKAKKEVAPLASASSSVAKKQRL